MSDFILVDGDQVIFLPIFTPAIVSVKPGKITAKGTAKTAGKKICIDGDEKSVEVKGCQYISGGFVIPGSGTLKIQALAANQKAKKTNNKKAVLLQGVFFTAQFQVQSPAKQPNPPAPPVPDPTPMYSGQGLFVASNKKWKAT